MQSGADFLPPGGLAKLRARGSRTDTNIRAMSPSGFSVTDTACARCCNVSDSQLHGRLRHIWGRTMASREDRTRFCGCTNSLKHNEIMAGDHIAGVASAVSAAAWQHRIRIPRSAPSFGQRVTQSTGYASMPVHLQTDLWLRLAIDKHRPWHGWRRQGDRPCVHD